MLCQTMLYIADLLLNW